MMVCCIQNQFITIMVFVNRESVFDVKNYSLLCRCSASERAGGGEAFR